MPALNFRARWADKVESGEKRQTIRAERKDHRAPAWPGAHLFLYTGMRTKSCRKLREATCEEASRLVITESGAVFNEDRRIVGGALERLASDDGFESANEFIEWFQKTHGFPFKGWLIRWSPERTEKSDG